MKISTDISPRWDNFALYLPSIQKQYAKAAYSTSKLQRPMPDGLTMKDLNFLNPKSKLWHYKYALYSAGQFKIGENNADIVTNRDKASTTILGDSGGYQIGKGTLPGFDALKKLKSADEVCEAWTNAVDVKRWILNWLETHSDFAMTLDMPLWAQDPANKKTPFHKCSTKQLIDLTVQNLNFIQRNTRGNTKWLNVIQGTTAEAMQQWWDAVSKYRFGGWALAGDTGWRGGPAAVIRQVLMMRDEGAFEAGLDWLHVLGVSQPKWAVLLTAIQRGLRARCNPNLRVSYDSASPNILSGKFQQVAIFPAYTKNSDSWRIRAKRAANGGCYVSGNPPLHFPHASALGDRLYLHHINVVNDKYSNVHYDEISHHLLTHHNTWVYVHAMLQANELAFLDRHDAEEYVPAQLLDGIAVFEDLLAMDKWEKEWKKQAPLFEKLSGLMSDDGHLVPNPIVEEN
jgi:hypothetical protein